jgi:hypothetical protein
MSPTVGLEGLFHEVGTGLSQSGHGTQLPRESDPTGLHPPGRMLPGGMPRMRG